MKKLGGLAAVAAGLMISFGVMASEKPTVATKLGASQESSVRGGLCNFTYSIQKVGPSDAKAGNNVTYKIWLVNAGTCDLKDIKVSDLLPRGTALVSASPLPTEVVGRKVIWKDVSLEEGDGQAFFVTVSTNPGDDGRVLTNTGCAFSPIIGIKICDSTNTLLLHP